MSKKLRDGYTSSREVAALLLSSKKLKGDYITKGQVVSLLKGDRKWTDKTLATMVVYGWATELNRSGSLVYRITTNSEQGKRNLEVMKLRYANQLALLEGNLKNTKKIQRIANGNIVTRVVRLYSKLVTKLLGR